MSASLLILMGVDEEAEARAAVRRLALSLYDTEELVLGLLAGDEHTVGSMLAHCKHGHEQAHLHRRLRRARVGSGRLTHDFEREPKPSAEDAP